MQSKIILEHIFHPPQPQFVMQDLWCTDLNFLVGPKVVLSASVLILKAKKNKPEKQWNSGWC